MPKKRTELGKAARLLILLDLVKIYGPANVETISEKLHARPEFTREKKETIKRRTFSDFKLLVDQGKIELGSEHGTYRIPGSETTFGGQGVLEKSGYKLEFPARTYPWTVLTSDIQVNHRLKHFRLMIFDADEPMFLSLDRNLIPMNLIVGRRWADKNRLKDKIADKLTDRYGKRTSYLGIPLANFRIGTAPEKRIHYGNLLITFDKDGATRLERCHSSLKAKVAPISQQQAELLQAIPFSKCGLSQRKFWWDTATASLDFRDIQPEANKVGLPAAILIEPNFKFILLDEGSQPNLRLKEDVNTWIQNREDSGLPSIATNNPTTDLVSQVETELNESELLVKTFPLVNTSRTKAG